MSGFAGGYQQAGRAGFGRGNCKRRRRVGGREFMPGGGRRRRCPHSCGRVGAGEASGGPHVGVCELDEAAAGGGGGGAGGVVLREMRQRESVAVQTFFPTINFFFLGIMSNGPIGPNL